MVVGEGVGRGGREGHRGERGGGAVGDRGGGGQGEGGVARMGGWRGLSPTTGSCCVWKEGEGAPENLNIIISVVTRETKARQT